MSIYIKKWTFKKKINLRGGIQRKKACALQAGIDCVGSRDFHGRVGVPGFGVAVSGHLPAVVLSFV